jgi:hypothetical protein
MKAAHHIYSNWLNGWLGWVGLGWMVGLGWVGYSLAGLGFLLPYKYTLWV